MTDPMSVWDTPSEVQTYRTESRTFEDVTFTVVRRALSVTEEARILATVIDKHTRHVNALELLAKTVQCAVKENNFGLTPERIRNTLPDRPNLMWFLYKWLCADTIDHMSNDSEDELRKKHGP